LDKVFVSHFLEAALVSNLPAGNEETEAEIGSGRGDAVVELNECLVKEAVEAGRLDRPVVFKVLAGFVFAGKFE
jgi:hypothetical protein